MLAMKTTTRPLAVRLDVRSLTLQQVCRVLPGNHAGAVSEMLRLRVGALLVEAAGVPDDVDEALTAEFASQLEALKR
jgi:hypothetical protein